MSIPVSNLCSSSGLTEAEKEKLKGFLTSDINGCLIWGHRHLEKLRAVIRRDQETSSSLGESILWWLVAVEAPVRSRGLKQADMDELYQWAGDITMHSLGYPDE